MIVTADRKADKRAQNILEWLYILPTKKNNKILSGQHGWNNAALIYKETGSWPAILELSLWNGKAGFNRWPHAKKNREVLKEYWDKGGLVSIHMPVPNPINKTSQLDRTNLKDDKISLCLQEGTVSNNNLNQWLTVFTSHIKWLELNGVIVFIRPLHEMNGSWFWYGKKDTDIYIKLYKYLFEFLVIKSDLHNILFVYSPSLMHNNLINYYPGDEYVDIVGADIYRTPPIRSEDMEAYNLLSSLGKPFAITELGWNSQKNTPAPNTQNAYKDIVLSIKETVPRTVWWNSWTDSRNPALQKEIKKLYRDPWVITRDEVNWKK
ncbi:MAG: glycosyl hydrolase [Candidatus Electrothrix sp. YB6]